MKEEQRIEQEILAKGLTAPRVTPADIEAAIQQEFYFRPYDEKDGNGQPLKELETTTICVLALNNGFTVNGESACASPENFDEDLGRKIARANAVNKIWPLLGYELKTKLALVNASQPLLEDDPLFKLGEPEAYVGTKVVYALPMTRQEYNDFRGWVLPLDEDGNDAGFLVQYADGGKANVEGFSGYLSWSPADVFDRAYIPVGSPRAPSTFLDRLKAEHAQLQERCEKLAQFLTSEGFQGLPDTDRRLLQDQYEYMTCYMGVLVQRLGRLSK